MSLSDWPLRVRLITIVVLPTAAALSLAGVSIQASEATAGVYRHARQQIQLDAAAARMAGALQTERDAMTGWIAAGRPANDDELIGSVATSRGATSAFQNQEGLVGEIGDVKTTSLYHQIVNRARSLDEVRHAAADAGFDPSVPISAYTAVIGVLLELEQQFDTAVTDEGLLSRHAGAVLLAKIKECSAQQGTYLRKGAVTGRLRPDEQAAMTQAGVTLVNLVTELGGSAVPSAREAYETTVTGDPVKHRYQLQELAEARMSGNLPIGLDPGDVARSSAQTLSLMSQVETRLLTEVSGYAGALYDQVWRALILTCVAVIGGLLLVMAVMAGVARSLLRPLLRLRGTAIDVAENQLPSAIERIMRDPEPETALEHAVEPVAVTSADEIGSVARAFDLVHEKAVRLAVEQALLRENVKGIFVDLAKRSQRLVDRQLGVIDRLEQDEDDADRLAVLFELDHLITLVRRNGDNLLVLSGTHSDRKSGKEWPVGEVIGAAISGIEQYPRVRVLSVPDAAVRGSAAHDLVHLIGELLDNATHFSEPATTVVVRAALRADDTLAIQISDQGIGITGHELADINARLTAPTDIDGSMTRKMGLHVVAQLARRHDIAVRLFSDGDEEPGVLARVLVPPSLIVVRREAKDRPRNTARDQPLRPAPRTKTGIHDNGVAQRPGDRHSATSISGSLPISDSMVANRFRHRPSQTTLLSHDAVRGNGNRPA
ncbi:sensor histidine kinase [Amycolatopsis pigmentata]|uniref:histidine kinase n=1 Tax=Amycolatopsis pigmentata TaxID=450801 RepID=A0ABW5FJA2_9PSEU